MLPQQATKHLSLDFLRQCRIDNCVSPGGIEYIEEDLDSLIMAKAQSRADSQLKLWINPSKAEEANDGMIDVLTTDQTKEEVTTMAIQFIDAEVSTAEVLKAGLSAETAELRTMRANLEMTTAEMNKFRTELFLATSNVEELVAKVEKARASTARVMMVQVDDVKRTLSSEAHPLLGRLLVNAKSGENSLLIGPAGCGKTSLAKQLAEALGRSFSYVCATAGASETWLFGRQTPTGFVEGGFSKAYRNGGVFLEDEYDAADANFQLAINTAIDSDSFYNPISGEIIPKHKDFVFIAASNTYCRGANAQYTGRNRQDAAALTRFIKIEMDYSAALESRVCPDADLLEKLWNARKALKEASSLEIISTRCIRQAYVQKTNGVTETDIFTSLTCGWPKDAVKRTGLLH